MHVPTCKGCRKQSGVRVTDIGSTVCIHCGVEEFDFLNAMYGRQLPYCVPLMPPRQLHPRQAVPKVFATGEHAAVRQLGARVHVALVVQGRPLQRARRQRTVRGPGNTAPRTPSDGHEQCNFIVFWY